MLIGGDGNDVIDGGRGNDMALMGAGNDTFVWNPGDGSDTVEGQAGSDTMLFNGANVNENINLSANGSRARLTRNVGNIVMDTNGVEQVDVNALGGADTITVGDLTGTGIGQVNLDLAEPAGQRRRRRPGRHRHPERHEQRRQRPGCRRGHQLHGIRPARLRGSERFRGHQRPTGRQYAWAETTRSTRRRCRRVWSS